VEIEPANSQAARHSVKFSARVKRAGNLNINFHRQSLQVAHGPDVFLTVQKKHLDRKKIKAYTCTFAFSEDVDDA
jgi:hypothetical protein